MTEGTPLSDLLNNEPEEKTEPEPATEARERDESGRFAAKGVEPAEPEAAVQEPVPPTDKLPEQEYKAIREEREKRQTLERELEALKTQIQSQQQPPAPPPSIWEDEEGYGSHIVSSAVQQATFNARLDMSEMMVRQAQPDFEEVKAEFLRLVDENPALRQQALADPHPWNKAYHIAKNYRAMQDLGATDMVTLEAKMREKIMAEMQGGQTAIPARSELPATLTGERSVASRSGPAWAGPTPLSDLLR